MLKYKCKIKKNKNIKCQIKKINLAAVLSQLQQDTSSSSEDSEDNIPLSILVAQAQANIASI